MKLIVNLARKLFYSLTIFLSLVVSAQSSQSEYLEAKRQFMLGNYRAAQQAFQSLTSDPVFGSYASFYYALAAWEQEDYATAENMWKQIQVKYPTWDKLNEVDFWLVSVAFETRDWLTAMERLPTLPDHLQDRFMYTYLPSVDYQALVEMQSAYPSDSILGTYLADVIKTQPYAEQDRELLRELMNRFDLATADETLYPRIKKDEYAIALLLPFMYSGLDEPHSVILNSIIFELYQGMLLGNEELQAKGVKLNLFPFDTQKSGRKTQEIIGSGKLEQADVIIGPLYPEPSKLADDFALENKISIINPLSSNDNIIGSNPYAYLFTSGYATQGAQAAKFAVRKFGDNKKVFIFYESQRDSIIAASYRQTMEKEGFQVVRFEHLTNEDARDIQRDFTQESTVRIDHRYTQAELDSLMLSPKRVIRKRPVRKGQLGVEKDEDGNPVMGYYETRYRVHVDSIGHIFVATSSNVLANNFISMVEVRSDDIGIVGYGDWLNFSLISYTQLERLGITFLSPSYYSRKSPSYHHFRKSYRRKYLSEPSDYAVYGFELIYQLGLLLEEHGKYFQRGLSSGTLIPGKLMEGLEYGASYDNQVVPITILKDLYLENVNNPSTN